MSEGKGTLVVGRTTRRDSGFRQVQVFVDGELVGTLDAGQSVAVDLEPGAHALRVYNTLVSKEAPVTVGAGETIRFTTGNRASGCLLALAASFGIGVFGVFLEREPADSR